VSARWALATACLAVALAFFAIFRVDPARSPLLSFRHPERWRSEESLLLNAPLAPLGSPRSLSDLYSLYARLAVGAEVRDLVLRDGPLHGDYRAFVSVDGKRVRPSGPAGCDRRTQLVTCRWAALNVGPTLVIEATARNRTYATATAARVSRGLRAYVRRQEDAAAIPSAARVRLLVVSAAASNSERVQGRRLIGPSAALAAVLVLLTLALISGRRSRRVES
jgi:hypothetical protein